MTASTENGRRLRTALPPVPSAAELDGPHRLMIGVRVIAVTAALAGSACLTAAYAREWRTAVVGSMLIVISAVFTSLWIANVLISDRRAFYERGKVDGWYAGWRGVPPDPDDPFLRL